MNREVAEGTCVQHITFLFEISFVDPMSLSYVPSRYYFRIFVFTRSGSCAILSHVLSSPERREEQTHPK